MKVLLQKSEQFNDYWYKSSSDTHLEFLAFFLVTDGFDHSNFFLNWLQDSVNDPITQTSGDVITLDKCGESITITSESCSHEEDNCDEESSNQDQTQAKCQEYFKTTRLELISILQQWVALLALRPLPEEVYLNQDEHGKLTFEIVKN